MNPYYPHLFSPMKVKNITYRNRIFTAPMALKEMTDHNFVDYHTFDFVERRAKGGAAVAHLSDCQVHETGTVEWSKKMHLYKQRSEPSAYTMATKIRAHGAVACVELCHAGMHFHDDNRINYGPSDRVDTFNQGDGNGDRTHVIHAFPIDMIHEVADSFGKAALRAKHCGFQQVLIHAGHGWLIAQFLSPLINQRTDEYGGCFENRARFGLEVVDSIRKYCGKDFIIEARVSWKEGMTEGYQLDESIKFCKLLEEHGVDLIHITAGSLHFHDTTPYTFPSWFDTMEGKNVEAAAEIKKHLSIPVGTVGACTDPAAMEKWIADGLIDYVVCGRALVADPDFPKKAKAGRTADIRPCLRCQACMTGGYYDLPHHCSVNPEVGRDSDFRFQLLPTDGKKRVLIAGGGPAGMQTALTAASRGHEVILCEKSDRLGGLLNDIDKESFKHRITLYREWMIRQIAKAPIDVRLNTEVTPELVEKIAPDFVIAAVGADAINAPVKGINENAVNILKFYQDGMPDLGKKIVVIGGGFAGMEAAIGQAMEGKDVTVIEMANAIASGPNTPYPGTGAMQIDSLQTNADKWGVKIMLNTRAVEVQPGKVLCEGPDGPVVYEADGIISAGGMKPREEIVEALRDTVIDFDWVGDCHFPGLIRTAVEAGFNAALDI